MTYEPKRDKQTDLFLKGINDIPDPQKDILVDESLKVITAAGKPGTDR